MSSFKAKISAGASLRKPNHHSNDYERKKKNVFFVKKPGVEHIGH